MARVNRLRGCYQRILAFLLVVVFVSFGVGYFLYQRFGGLEGARYWMAEHALNSVEAHLLQKSPDGSWMRKPDDFSEDQIRERFQNVRDAIAERRVDLIRLDRVLRAYETKFQKTQPSVGEVTAFLNDLESTITLIEDSQ